MVNVRPGGAEGHGVVPESGIYDGRQLGRYRLRYRLARGGMGTVYLASTEGPAGFGKWFAVKLMHPHLADARELVARFHDEARVASGLHHPNVCSVVDFGQEPDGVLYLVLEYLHGEALSAILQKCGARVPWWLACQAVIDGARGLHAAHELRDRDGRFLALVHRDVSPQNLFVLYDGPCKILDFGVARIRDQITTTQEGQLRGKIPYMSPEQVEALPLDRRSDVWALGVVLWEAIAGARLFKRERAMDSMRAILAEPIPRLAEVRPGVSPELDAIVARALARHPEHRYATAAELADALASLVHRSGERCDHARVAAWMKEEFREEMAAREAALRAPEPERAQLADVVTPPPSWSGPEGATAFRPGEGRDRAARDHAAHGPTELVSDAGHDPTEVAVRPLELVAEEPRRRGPAALKGRHLGVGALAVTGAAGIALALYFLGPLRGGAAEHAVASTATVGGPARLDEVASQAAPARSDDVASQGGPAPLAPAVPDVPAVTEPVEPPPEPGPPTVEEPRAPGADEVDESSAGAEVTAARASAVPPGRLDLIVFPEAVVSWRGRRLGRTPLSTTLPPGRQTLRLATDDGRVESITVVVRSGERLARNHRIGS